MESPLLPLVCVWLDNNFPKIGKKLRKRANCTTTPEISLEDVFAKYAMLLAQVRPKNGKKRKSPDKDCSQTDINGPERKKKRTVKDDSSSSDEESSSEEEGKTENRHDLEANEVDESSDDSDSDSEDETETKVTKHKSSGDDGRRKKGTKWEDNYNSDSDDSSEYEGKTDKAAADAKSAVESDSDSNDSSSEEEKTEKASKVSKKNTTDDSDSSDSDSSSEDQDEKGHKKQTASSDSEDSSSDSDSDDESSDSEKKSRKNSSQKKKKPAPVKSFQRKRVKGRKQPKKQNRPFQRVRADAVKFLNKNLMDNTYNVRESFGRKASETLLKVKGKDFVKSKNKHKRKTFFGGGRIDMGVRSVKIS